MKTDIINICDRISINEDISMREFKTISQYLKKANQFKKGNPNDVVSEFLLDVRLNYNKDRTQKEKEARVYAHIKRAIQKVSIFDNKWTLYNPTPAWVDGSDLVDEQLLPSDLTRDAIDDILLWVDWLIKDWLERDIYESCIKWNTHICYIAKEHWKSAEWWRVIKNRILKKIENYIENMPK